MSQCVIESFDFERTNSISVARSDLNTSIDYSRMTYINSFLFFHTKISVKFNFSKIFLKTVNEDNVSWNEDKEKHNI